VLGSNSMVKQQPVRANLAMEVRERKSLVDFWG